jgi:TolB-like protein/lipoprotein NlpI
MLVDIVNKALEKDRELRYQHAADIRSDLKRLKRDLDPGRGAAGSDKSVAAEPGKARPRRSKAIDRVAVLPLVNASADPETDYFSDGVTESIIGSLSQLPGLRVMARSTVFRYKGRDVDSQTVGRELNVHAVVAGRVLQRGDSVILGLELVDVEDGAQLWSCYYNRKLDEIFSLQEKIAAEISENLRLRLTGAQKKRLTKRHTQNLDAYQLYLKGRFHWNRRAGESLKKSIEFFEQAIEKDPSYALAYSGLADACNISPYHVSITPQEVFPKGKSAARKAVASDDTLAEAHTSLAHVKAVYDWDWPGAEREFRRALELNPNYAMAHHWYGMHYLAPMGKLAEAITEMQRAVELDPVSPVINTNLGAAYYFGRQDDRAIEQFRKALELDPEFGFAHRYLMDVYAEKGMFREAIEEFIKGGYLEEGTAEGTAELREAYARRGEQGYWGKRLELAQKSAAHRYVPPSRMAHVYAHLGERDKAFESLETALAEHDAWVFWLKTSPDYTTLRPDPRFQDLVRRVGLPP